MSSEPAGWLIISETCLRPPCGFSLYPGGMLLASLDGQHIGLTVSQVRWLVSSVLRGRSPWAERVGPGHACNGISLHFLSCLWVLV